MKQESMKTNGRPHFSLILTTDNGHIYDAIETILTLMLYDKGYYHLFDGSHIVKLWNIDKEGLITVQSTPIDGLKVIRTDILEFRETGKLLNSIKENIDLDELNYY